MKDWTKILTSQNAFLAQLILMDLQAAGFEAVLVNKKDSSYVNFGFCEVFVPSQVELEVRVWLLENHPNVPFV